MSKFISTILALLLVGCAASVEEQKNTLSSSKVCCQSYADIPFAHSLVKEETVEVNSDSPVFSFLEGRSYFSAFSLPSHLSGKTMILRSFAGSPVIADGRGAHQFFFPVVTFLDSERRKINSAYDSQPVGELYGWSKHGILLGKIKVPQRAAFGVLHTMPESFGKLYVQNVQGPGFTAVVGKTIVSSGSGTAPLRAVFSATGKIQISVEE